ncbi:hypothetical protein RRG08_021691 [Elysia crispata]|uniref:Uncharacterized protein n=1 Tax=Elysia crispata TaxID=231223 RepID=A0AAE0ZYE5_9GAST|nr:hypothetical protein RRG08_021691 [Elysia crispata]
MRSLDDFMGKKRLHYRHKVLYETFNTKTKVDKVEPNNPFRPGYKAVFIRPEVPHKHLRAHLQNMKWEMQRRFPGRDGVITMMYGAQVLSCFRDVGLGVIIPNVEKYGVQWERSKLLISNVLSKL